MLASLRRIGPPIIKRTPRRYLRGRPSCSPVARISLGYVLRRGSERAKGSRRIVACDKFRDEDAVDVLAIYEDVTFAILPISYIVGRVDRALAEWDSCQEKAGD